MRIESVIAVNATDTVGPTRLRVLTASSSRQPVVVVADTGNAVAYHVFDVDTVRSAMGAQLSATKLDEALGLGDQTAREPVSKAAHLEAAAGSPVVENGRLIGVVADELPEQKEFTEADMARGGQTPSTKRGIWKRLTGSGD